MHCCDNINNKPADINYVITMPVKQMDLYKTIPASDSDFSVSALPT